VGQHLCLHFRNGRRQALVSREIKSHVREKKIKGQREIQGHLTGDPWTGDEIPMGYLVVTTSGEKTAINEVVYPNK